MHRPVISSAANPRIRAVVGLRDRRERERTGLTVVDGGRELLRAIAAGVGVDEVFVCPDILSADARAAHDRLFRDGTPTWSVTSTAFRRLAFGDRTEGIVGVVRIPSTALLSVGLPSTPLVVVAEAVEKPGNLGAILRTADGAGVDALVAADPRTDLYNPNTIRASLGTVFAVPVASASSEEVRAWLRSSGIRIVVARVDADRLYTDTDLTGPLALVVGSEATGLTATWSGDGVDAVRLPMLGVADSLNVSAAAAVLLYEARRQRDAAAARQESGTS